MKGEHLNLLVEKGILSHLDTHFAGFMTALAGGDNPELFLAAALVSNFKGQGHICLDISSVAGKQLFTVDDAHGSVACPEADVWKEKLEKTPVVGRPGQYCPLILDERSRLYLYRYYQYQKTLAGLLNDRIHAEKQDFDMRLLREGLSRLFPEVPANDPDWQKVAAFGALTHKFCVISGGPGTGKTTTIAKILALILEQAGDEKTRIALAAPTGKAASRLQEAMKSTKNNLDCADVIRAAIPVEASTIHRLLGSIPNSPYFRHNAGNRLPVDTLIVDEASMVDMALMSKLVQALPGEARLILLGDKDQLASVEAGAVLGDICDSGHTHGFSERFLSDLKEITGLKVDPRAAHGDSESAIRDCMVQLQKNYRFGDDSGISAVSRAVNAGDSDLSIRLMKNDNYEDIKWKPLPRPDSLPGAIRQMIITGFEEYLNTDDPWEVFKRFERFRILCALRKGPYGVSALNLLAEQVLKGAKLIDPVKTWYPGRPVLITRNDYNLGLFNGDVGVVLRDPEADHDLRVFFPGADGMLKRLHPLRLPDHENVFAMTVHKSQGSEFDNVLLILPDRDYPVLTRELIYTAITRARDNVELWAAEDVFRAAVSRRTERVSGLRDALWET